MFENTFWPWLRQKSVRELQQISGRVCGAGHHACAKVMTVELQRSTRSAEPCSKTVTNLLKDHFKTEQRTKFPFSFNFKTILRTILFLFPKRVCIDQGDVRNFYADNTFRTTLLRTKGLSARVVLQSTCQLQALRIVHCFSGSIFPWKMHQYPSVPYREKMHQHSSYYTGKKCTSTHLYHTGKNAPALVIPYRKKMHQVSSVPYRKKMHQHSSYYTGKKCTRFHLYHTGKKFTSTRHTIQGKNAPALIVPYRKKMHQYSYVPYRKKMHQYSSYYTGKKCTRFYVYHTGKNHQYSSYHTGKKCTRFYV